MRVGTTTTFVASSTGLANPSVIWSANGVVGGSAAAGTISSVGVFTAPLVLPSPDSVIITGSSVAEPSLTASLTLTVLNPVPVLQSAVPTVSGTISFIVALDGTGFTPQSSASFNGLAVVTTFISATHLQATLLQATYTAPTAVAKVSNPSPGAADSNTIQVALPQPPPTSTSAARLLDQTTFGATLGTIEHVQSVGLSGYLDEQLALPPTIIPQWESGGSLSACPRGDNCANVAFWQNALTAPDQLRQRVGFALSQMWVVSTIVDDDSFFAFYENTLSKDAFGNWRTLMQDVTLTPAMGNYLNMEGSYAPQPSQIANENFGREMLQLFSIGVNEMNPDGTLVLDSTGQPIPNYTSADVQNFARAYTGWHYPNVDCVSQSADFQTWQVTNCPLVAFQGAHDLETKTLLRGVVLSGGQAGGEDLSAALDNIFSDPSLPPFVCQQLIRKLIKSDPSPEYVSRVSSVFVDNGQGVRGDMNAVLRAIFLDSEARSGDDGNTTPTDAGHLREPILWLTSVLRGLGAMPKDGHYGVYYGLEALAGNMGQKPRGSPSVFNFYSPSYKLPNTDTFAPEFQINNAAGALERLNAADAIADNQVLNTSIALGPSSPLGQLAAVSPDALLDGLNVLFLNGRMTADMRTTIKSAISGATDPAQEVRLALYLVITSPQYEIEQ